MNTLIGRISEFITFKNISITKFERSISVSKGLIAKAIKGNTTIGADKLEKIISVYEEVNLMWLVTGEGEMLKNSESNQSISIYDKTLPQGAVPYWNLLVSAGHSVEEITGQSKPDGYIKGLPGADIAENILPVMGASMEPEVTNGAIIGIKRINNWETLNTERIYFIVTRDDRMIKRIEYDLENEDILWCVSPNYPKFKIFKTDIVEIQRVCFVYNPK